MICLAFYWLHFSEIVIEFHVSVLVGVVSVFCVKAFCLLTGIAWCLKSDDSIFC